MTKKFRNGAVGALMDEYERVLSELESLIQRIPDEDFERVVDTQTTDDACRSAQTIMSHVIRAGYGYADSIREQFSITSTRPKPELLSRQQSLDQLQAIVDYTAQTLDGKWEMSEEAIMSTVIKSSWGVTYDLEQLLEHAVLHVMRHWRQIERFVARGAIQCN